MKIVKLTCAICCKYFYRKLAEITRNKKRGRNSVYCSRECRDKAITIPLKVRFQQYIGPTTPKGCILWTGTISSNGYGRILKDSSHPGPRILQAHRLAWEYANGPIPNGFDILHTCDNPPCINPEHLVLGTQQDNMADMVSKGRQHKGQTCHLSQLTEEIVLAIRSEYKRRRVTLQYLADKYDTTFSNVSAIIRRKSWKHI